MTDFKGLDNALAQFMMTPTSGEALRMSREARNIRIRADAIEDEVLSRLAEEHYGDCLRLHDSILTLESDPEIVSRNLAARVISGVFPVLNAFEEFRSFEDKTVWDMVINSLGVLAEIATATQYLEATKLSSSAHAERALVEVEERLARMAENTGEDIEEKVSLVEDFLDEVRSLNLAPRKKPFVPFILWLLITVLSYKQLQDVK
jgi:hypothetical protein